MLLRHFLSNPQAIGNVLNICEKSTSGQQSSLANFWRGEMLKEEIFWSCTLIKPEIFFYTKVNVWGNFYDHKYLLILGKKIHRFRHNEFQQKQTIKLALIEILGTLRL